MEQRYSLIHWAIFYLYLRQLCGIYSAAYKKITEFGYPVIQTTRRMFLYGVIFMIPFLFFMDFELDLSGFANPVALLNILYLGFGACALCFLTWNYAVTKLGAVKSSYYIYLVPVITVVMSSIILKEQMTVIAMIGTVLTIVGLFVSES
jgi:drug/metabolite transporter (DMT)-like permease